ncbi:MAG: hypothetical protein WBP53_09825 [Dokdonella sp.]
MNLISLSWRKALRFVLSTRFLQTSQLRRRHANRDDGERGIVAVSCDYLHATKCALVDVEVLLSN